MTRSFIRPGEIIGYLPSGKAVRAIAGGAGDEPPFAPPAAPGQDPSYPPATVPQGYFTAEQLEKVRSEERDKLYRKLSKQDNELSELKQMKSQWEADREAAAQAERDRIAAQEEAARKAREEELSVRQLLDERTAQFEARFAQERAEREAERAAAAKEREFLALQNYIQRRAAEERDGRTVAPELIDLITGNSEEQVEASIAVLRQKSDALVASMGNALQGVVPAAPPRGVSSAGYAATGPMDIDSGTKTYSPEEISRMSMEEYAEKIRPHFIGQAGRPNSSNGLFG
jgi:hypothetical protein